ncbi:uncharacterized protein LOC103851900 [Brassica rapa]|uniref:Uncharacterized protein n=1 Tax=Brassica campestris TaxID=3711 RepID=A0A3P6ANL0_BRACM|nr:uncharacterized protein LOC103851900 [Brassica rapa]CAG7892508.1 unnamed protein product [Brassica rapa]VDC86900.1 unnamed protein product [Brassica rapa]
MLRNYVNRRLIAKPNIRSSCLYSLYLKRGSASGSGREEGRDPLSMVEEIERQGIASQTSEKAYDGAAEAVNVSSDSGADKEKVKKEFEKREEGRDYRKRCDDDGLPINTAKGV